ncbi:hypothetical protein SDC9_203343 [bioreactor metagenome]|uniref:Uncharacterized protein n=1 Tax=bioreactor metagenome TaxID=1076179 RepID=A0A645IYX3_9ZZZZ
MDKLRTADVDAMRRLLRQHTDWVRVVLSRDDDFLYVSAGEALDFLRRGFRLDRVFLNQTSCFGVDPSSAHEEFPIERRSVKVG